jgi:hypothetical protein
MVHHFDDSARCNLIETSGQIISRPVEVAAVLEIAMRPDSPNVTRSKRSVLDSFVCGYSLSVVGPGGNRVMATTGDADALKPIGLRFYSGAAIQGSAEIWVACLGHPNRTRAFS